MAKSRNPNVPDDMLPKLGRPPAESDAQSAAEHVPIGTTERDCGLDSIVAHDDLLAALTSISNDTLSGIDQTLEHLTTSNDLFDVPPLDPGTT